jgi:hypothetical protein
MFFDLSKAFDCVNHELLLVKLDSLGIRGISNNWIRSYLHERKQMVIVKENGYSHSSHNNSVPHGVPQGSVLGPVLFLLYINDLPGIYSNIDNVTPILYADDTNFIVSSDNHCSILQQCKLAAQSLEDWCKHNFLHLNVNKSQIMYIMSRGKQNKDIPVNINQSNVLQVTQAKFLGLHLDSYMTWEPHICELASKLSAKCYMIRFIRHTVSTDVLLSLYFGEFYSRMVYGILFWGSSSRAIVIFKLQKKAVRLIVNAPISAPCRPIFKTLGLLPLPCVYIYYVLMYVQTNIAEFQKNSSVHNYSTRLRNDLHIPFVRTSNASLGPRAMGIRLFNKLPTKFKEIKKITIFKKNIKDMLQKKLYYSLNEYLLDEEL